MRGMEEPDTPPSREDPLDEGTELTAFGRAYDFFQRHRRRMATLVLGIFIIAVVIEIGGALPRDVDVSYSFPAHEEVTEARLEYSSGGELVREVTLRWPVGAPRRVRDTIELSPGDYDVSVLLLERDGGMRQLRGVLTAPADGVVQVRLRE